MQIILKDILLHGFHGVHPLEKKVGTAFRINVLIDLEEKSPINTITDTLDYATVFETVKKEFKQTEDLLEVLLERTIYAIAQLSSKIVSIEISIVKLTAPISGFKGEVGVRLKKQIR